MSIEIQQIPDYSVNLELLLEQYKQSYNLRGLIDSMNDQADDLESALFEIRNEFYLSTAFGIQLDIIGTIFGESRNGRDDDEFYREALQLRASILSSGEPEAIIAVLKSVYKATFAWYYPGYPAQPASFYMVTDADISQAHFERLSPAGVGAYLAVFLIDAQDNYIVDGRGNRILVLK